MKQIIKEVYLTNPTWLRRCDISHRQPFELILWFNGLGELDGARQNILAISSQKTPPKLAELCCFDIARVKYLPSRDHDEILGAVLFASRMLALSQKERNAAILGMTAHLGQ